MNLALTGNGFWIALGFLTRLPTRHVEWTPEHQRSSLAWYPLIGLLLGTLLWLAALPLQHLSEGAPLVAGVLLVGLWIGLTGALHLDGLADTIDAWVGGLGDRERSLAIMKDPHVGSSAVVWLCLYLIAKTACLSALLLKPALLPGLLLAAAAGRLTPLILFRTTPYARQQGLGSAIRDGAPVTLIAFYAIALPLLTGLLYSWTTALLLPAVIAGAFLLYRRWLLQRLGGCTGDTAGALIEATELLCLLTVLMTCP